MQLLLYCNYNFQLILDRISKGMTDKVKKAGPFANTIFDFAYDYKLKWADRGFDTPILDKLIFGAAKKALGGRMRLILSAGAPLSSETHRKVKLCLCITVIQGYGLTETSACATGMDSTYRFFFHPFLSTLIEKHNLRNCLENQLFFRANGIFLANQFS